MHSSDRSWFNVAAGARRVEAAGKAFDARTAELRSVDGTRLIVWQWYWVNGRLLANDYQAKVYTAFYRLLGQGDDSASLIVYAEKRDGSEELLRDFVKAHLPAIERTLEMARDARD